MWYFTLLTTSPLILVSIKSSLILKDSLIMEKFIRGQCLLASLHPPSPLLMQLLRVLRALSPFIISRDRKHSQNITGPHLWELKQLPGVSANTTELLKSRVSSEDVFCHSYCNSPMFFLSLQINCFCPSA